MHRKDWLICLSQISPLIFSGEDQKLLQAIVHRYHGRTGILSNTVETIEGAIMRKIG